MGRPSKLTDKQWAEIECRMVAGESIRKLAKEFGVSDGAIRLRLSAQVEEIKSVANQIVATEDRLRSMPITAQVSTHNLADQLRSISGHLAGAANYGASTAHRLAGIANGLVVKIDDAKPMDEKSITELKAIAGLTKMANDASEIGLNLLRANKESIDAMNKGDAPEDMHWTVNLVPADAG
jgi:uncharacterized protein (DUF2342 family)